MTLLPISQDIAEVQAISAVPRILRAITEITGMRFSCIARVTEASWTICAVHDAAGYGLIPGSQLPIDTTFCSGVRATGEPVVFDSACASSIYRDHPSPKLYGFDSYASLPLYHSNGQFFGTLCALDPLPATPSNAATFATLRLFAELISNQLYAEARLQEKTTLHESASEQLRVTLLARSEAEKALVDLKESEDRFRAAMAATGVMWTNDANGEMTGEQRGWSALTGQTEADYAGYGWAQAIHPDDAAATISAWNEAVAKRHTFKFEHRIRRYDGVWRTFAVKAVPVIADNGIVREWVGVHTDITERKQFEQDLAVKEARIRLATDVVGLGIWTWNPHIDLVTWENDNISDIFGVSGDFTPINAALFANQFLHPDDVPLFQKSVQAVLDFGEKLFFQGRIYRADNQALRWVELNGETHETSPGVHGVLGTVTDITARKQGEQALESLAEELKNADRHKSEFIATLAHELRNPLAPIRNGVQLLRMASADPCTVSRVAEVMERQLGQMVHLIDDLLDVTRISRGQIQLCRQLIDLKQIAAMAVETSLPLIEARNHDLTVDFGNVPIPLMADSGRIAQVISNLLTNAAKYTPKNGKIFLTAKREEASAVVTVLDTGIGIPAEAMDHLFDMFSQVDRHRSQAQGGLGIGLALVRTLVQLHGGSVCASSGGDGLGSMFVVRLPLATASDANAAA
ncbi:MAG: PAS domain-containing protein [Bdellovibrionales bacterium]|nr:PAS domain-containing protein [Massilia sp.]